MAQKEYLGGVEATTLSSGITNVDTAISVADGSTFPTGSSFPFVIVIDRGTASEEKILCASRSGNSITATTRGYDGTSGVSHTSGAVVEHCIDAIVVNKASELISKATTQGDLVYWSAAETPVRLAKGTARQALLMNAGATAPEWGVSLASLLTTQSDIPYASAANTPARLAKGTAGQSLVMNATATAPEWRSGGMRELGRASVTANQTGVGTSDTDLTGLSVSVTIGAHPVIVRGMFRFQKKVSQGYVQGRIRDVTGSATIDAKVVTSVAGGYGVMVLENKVSPAAGSRTYKIDALAENDTFDMLAAATESAWIQVVEVVS